MSGVEGGVYSQPDLRDCSPARWLVCPSNVQNSCLLLCRGKRLQESSVETYLVLHVPESQLLEPLEPKTQQSGS